MQFDRFRLSEHTCTFLEKWRQPNMKECWTKIQIVSQNEVLQSPSFQWTRPAVLRLIALYKENEAKFQKPAIKKKTVWQEIANKITEHLLPVTWQQCEQKWKNMTKAYRDTIDNNRKSGADRKECPFFKEIGEIYGYRPNVTPLHCEGSMAEAGESESSTGSEEPGASTCSSPIKKKKQKTRKNKTDTVIQLIEDMKEEQRELITEIRKQHEDRMTTEKQKIELLSKLLKD
ncbi:uncharacterized protein LOC132722481 [Ruditapes philippinarum]|uniref:uncharacterized protein LOC132722481 n=1 Tax=Ruditapes philippinarum TaxID=129788 RepID=UPI00295C0047|nr:uncharacterized protein LOC132722481 [Ruditapes philippinarum]